MMILTSITDLTMQAAIEADRKRGGEPSSLAEVWRINADEAEAYGQPDRADTLRECAAEVERLAAPQPADPTVKESLSVAEPVAYVPIIVSTGQPAWDATLPKGHPFLDDFKDKCPWRPLYAAPQPADPDAATFADYEAVLSDHRRLVRELDVLLNGEEGAAEQASLCDIVAQVRREGIKTADPVKAPSDADAKHVRDFINCDGMGAVIVEGPQYSAVVRTLLARYGQQATPQEPPSSD